MDKRVSILLLLCLLLSVMPLAAQSAEVVPVISVRDQVSLDGTVIIDRVESPQAGWIAIHSNISGTPGPVVGIAPIAAGVNEGVRVSLDLLGARPSLLAMLYVDDGQIGVFEFGTAADADAPLTHDGLLVVAPFSLTALRVYDQQILNSTVIIASAVSDTGSWMVIQTDNGGAPGDVIGYSFINETGNSLSTVVLLDQALATPRLWASLHVDDGEIGVFEFEAQGGNDAPLSVNEVTVSSSFAIADQPTLFKADGSALAASVGEGNIPSININFALTDDPTPISHLILDRVVAAVDGWVDVRADNSYQPGKSLGIASVPAGESVGVVAVLNPNANPTTPPYVVPPLLWAVLHVDDHQAGVHDYLRVPDADLPVIYNGSWVVSPVLVSLFETP